MRRNARIVGLFSSEFPPGSIIPGIHIESRLSPNFLTAVLYYSITS